MVGDYPTLTALAVKPLHYARCFEDKLITYSNLVRALSSSGKFDECINTCVSVLSELGESIPTTVTQEIYFEEVAQVLQDSDLAVYIDDYIFVNAVQTGTVLQNILAAGYNAAVLVG